MHEVSLDFRSLTMFKNGLFDSDLLEENHLVPLAEWKRLKEYHMLHSLDPVE